MGRTSNDLVPQKGVTGAMRVLALITALSLAACESVHDIPAQNPQPKATAFLQRYFPGQTFEVECPRDAAISTNWWLPCTAVRQNPRLVISLMCSAEDGSRACYIEGSVQ